MNRRIWELDALRGLCVIGMVIVHLIYDASELFDLISFDLPSLFDVVQDWGGVTFLLISGICATLGSRSVRRGFLVFGCGMAVTAVTAAGYLLGFYGRGMIIWFGVLHCLGICMILWSEFRRFPPLILAVFGVMLCLLGWKVQNITLEFPWLTPLGLTTRWFASSDYYPILPYFGFFLMGAVLGKTLYRNKKSLLSNVNTHSFPISFLLLCGKHSLPIYLLHQPVLLAGMTVISQIC